METPGQWGSWTHEKQTEQAAAPENVYGFYPAAWGGEASDQPVVSRASLEELRRWESQGVEGLTQRDDRRARDLRSAERTAWYDQERASESARPLGSYAVNNGERQ